MIDKEDILMHLDPVTRPHLKHILGGDGALIASVLLIIHYNYGQPQILLTKRSSGLKSHAGEVCFPGGAYIEEDRELHFTALRETKEELGLAFKEKDICGSLEPVRTVTSNYIITPYITVQDNIPKPRIFSDEVQRILDVPLVGLLTTLASDRLHGYTCNEDRFIFKHEGEVIWGATASIVKQIYDRIFLRGYMSNSKKV
jgi:8-oxo-dGTP pyrophosphatase MutT (NUDIX family)